MISAARLKLPLRQGVPTWLGIVTVFAALLPMLMVNGAYTGSAVDVSGTLGAMSEDILMTYYATAVGMAIGYPSVRKLRVATTPKATILIGLAIQTLLSIICAHATTILVMMTASVLIGFTKSFVIFECVVLIRPLFTEGIRSEFYAWFYPIAFGVGQISIAITAQLAYYYNWQYIYYLVLLMTLVGIILVMCCFRYMPRPTVPLWRNLDWKSVMLVATVMLMTIYLFLYGRTLDWFASVRLRVLAVLIPPLAVLFLFRQRDNGGRFIHLFILRSVSRLVGYVFVFLAMMFATTNVLITRYQNTVLRIDSLHANFLCLWMIPGFIVGGMVCFWYFRLKPFRYQYFVSIGFLSYTVYLALIYFGVAPTATYEALRLPMFFRGLGMIMLFIALALLLVGDLSGKSVSSNTLFMVGLRSAIAPAVSSSMFTNWLYHLQTAEIVHLAVNMRADYPLFTEAYSSRLSSALQAGESITDATLTVNQAYLSSLQQQTMLIGIKEIVGWMLICAIIATLASLLVPFQTKARVTILRGDDVCE